MDVMWMEVDGGGWRWKGRWDGADENIGPWRRDWQVGLRAGGSPELSKLFRDLSCGATG